MLVQLVTVFIIIRTGTHDASFRYGAWYCTQYVNAKLNTYINALEWWVVSMYKGKPSRSTSNV